MTIRAEEIWKSFCNELIVEPTDDMKEALSTAVRAVAKEFYYDPDVDLLYEIADELDEL